MKLKLSDIKVGDKLKFRDGEVVYMVTAKNSYQVYFFGTWWDMEDINRGGYQLLKKPKTKKYKLSRKEVTNEISHKKVIVDGILRKELVSKGDVKDLLSKPKTKKVKKWVPKKGDFYYFCEGYDVDCCEWDESESSLIDLKENNVFKTEALALKALKKIKRVLRLSKHS